MRKPFIMIALVIATALLFTACGKKRVLNSSFTSSFTAQNENTDAVYEGTVSKSEGSLTVTITSPYTVKGTSFTYRGSKLSICRGVLTTEADSDYLPDDSIPAVLHLYLAYLSQATYSGSENGIDRYTVNAPEHSATLTAVDGTPNSLSDPETGWVFRFSE